MYLLLSTPSHSSNIVAVKSQFNTCTYRFFRFLIITLKDINLIYFYWMSRKKCEQADERVWGRERERMCKSKGRSLCFAIFYVVIDDLLRMNEMLIIAYELTRIPHTDKRIGFVLCCQCCEYVCGSVCV